MRTAEEIYKKVVSGHGMITYLDAAIQAINEARKEAIEECADLFADDDKIYCDLSEQHLRESILELLKELQ